ncbi:MAG: type II toxin-antitoxin system RelE/ParE family toxin [Thermodesulfobacteriota bacterium]|nr:type II toxin-antitoxin system RelE/ParE family toxin [Thermodesulfobacteriota bacterium]
MTKHFSKWASKQKIHQDNLLLALTEVQDGNFEASLGGHIYKKRIKFKGQGKSGSGRTIICYKKGNRAIFIHGFAKNQKSNLSKKELSIFKELSRILLNFSTKEMLIAITNGDIIEVKS